MHETIVSEVWGELKRFVNTVDRADAADIVISVMIDHDCDIDDIKAAFKGDSDIKRALAAYIDDGKHDDEDLDEDLDEDWEN